MPEQISLDGSLDESIDDSSFEGIYERAVGRLKEQAPWWTHQEVCDPGITLIEMWAMLADMQSYYMDQIQESHYRKYLKLLGMDADAGECAAVWVFFGGVDRECVIPQGSKLFAQEMVFETEEEVGLSPNSLTGFYQEEGRNRVAVMRLNRKSCFVLREDAERVLFSFALKYAVQAGEELRFFILLDERGKRNPAGEGFYMAKLAWEYYTEDGWRKARILRDDTHGLLYSGILCLKFAGGGTCAPQNGQMVRCRVKEGAYDAMPVLYKICLNAVRAVQKDTLCCAESAEFFPGGGRAALKCYLAKTGRLQILLEEGENRFRDITAECDIDPPVTAERRERFFSCPREGKIKIICTADGVAEEYLPCPVTGVPSQRISLPWENIMKNTAELMLCGKDGIYRMYLQTDASESRYALAWHWQEEKNVIVLGDGRHGDIPEPCADGLRFTSLARFDAEKGNISIGRITQWEKAELFPGISCKNDLAGSGGRSAKKPSEQFDGIAGVVLKANRMVTKEDVRELVKETPGLLLQDAAAQWKSGAVVVTVIPSVPLNDEYCIGKYRDEVTKYLEPFRLAGSRLEVVVCPAGTQSIGRESHNGGGECEEIW